MFRAAYFAARYWLARYWRGDAAAPATGTALEVVRMQVGIVRSTVCQVQASALLVQVPVGIVQQVGVSCTAAQVCRVSVPVRQRVTISTEL